MKAYAWFNAVIGFIVAGLAFAGACIAATGRDWFALFVFGVIEVVTLRGAIRSASWLVNQETR